MKDHSSYYPNYFSITDILSTQERVPCKCEVPLLGLGYLDPSSSEKDMAVGTKLELPVWLASPLLTGRRSQHIITAQLPNSFREKFREVVKAEASVIDLHKCGPFFYETGLHLLPIAGAEASSLGSFLTQALRDRLRYIMDSSLNSLTDDSSSLTARLDEQERQLFRVGQAALRDHNLWLSRRSHILLTSALIQKHNKRKFAETQ